jgi:hypothetical protein
VIRSKLRDQMQVFRMSCTSSEMSSTSSSFGTSVRAFWIRCTHHNCKYLCSVFMRKPVTAVYHRPHLQIKIRRRRRLPQRSSSLVQVFLALQRHVGLLRKSGCYCRHSLAVDVTLDGGFVSSHTIGLVTNSDFMECLECAIMCLLCDINTCGSMQDVCMGLLPCCGILNEGPTITIPTTNRGKQKGLAWQSTGS